MPRYHALQTAVTISTWDPGEVSQSTSDRSSTRQESSTDTPSSASNQLTAPLSKTSRLHTEGPAAGHLAQDLRETYFDGHEGVDFLAGCMPFFLIRAGGDLFEEPAHLQNTNHHTNESPSVGHSFQLSALRSACRRSNTPSVERDSDSFLSSIPSSRFDSPIPGFDDMNNDPVKVEENSSNPQSTEQAEVKTAISKPIPTVKPIQVVIDVSHKSFMHSLITNTRQELCVNIFFNGELAQSRIVKHSCLHGPTDIDNFQIYSGRRVDTHLEVPWVIALDGCEESTEVMSPGSFEARWDQINQLLAVEANEWGKHGKYRSVMGEYLEELSKKTLPQSLQSSTNGKGGRAGIIDVVITLGKSVAISAAGLKDPHRKLHQDYTGKERRLIIVPEEKGPKKKEQIVTISDSESRASGERLKDTSAVGIPKGTKEDDGSKGGLIFPETGIMVRSSEKEDSKAADQVESMGEKDPALLQSQGSPPNSIPPPPKRSIMVDSSPSLPLSFGMDGSGSFNSPFTPPAREHPRKPKNVPQKTYKGDTPPEIVVKEDEPPSSSYTLRSRTVPPPGVSSTPASESADQQTMVVSCRSSRESGGLLVSEISALISRRALLEITDYPEDNFGTNSSQHHTADETEFNFGLDGAGDRSRRVRKSQAPANISTGKENKPPNSSQDQEDTQPPTERPSKARITVVFTAKNKIVSAPVNRQKLLSTLNTPKDAGKNSSSSRAPQPADHSQLDRSETRILPPSNRLLRTRTPAKSSQPASSPDVKHMKVPHEGSQNSEVSSTKLLHQGKEQGTPSSDIMQKAAGTGGTTLPTSVSLTAIASDSAVSASKNGSKRFRSESISSVAVSEVSSTADRPLKKKVRLASRSMSVRELGGLFDAHSPSMGVDASLGVSFGHTTRSSRASTPKLNSNTKAPYRKSQGRSQKGFGLNDTDVFSDVAQTSGADRKTWSLPKPRAGSRRVSTPTLPPSSLREKKSENTELPISKHKGGNLRISEGSLRAKSMLAPKSTNTMVESAETRLRSRSYSQSSKGLKIPEPRKDQVDNLNIFKTRARASRNDKTDHSKLVKTGARATHARVSDSNRTTSDIKATSFLERKPSNPALRRINSTSPGDSITVDPISDQSPAPKQNSRSRSLSSPKVFTAASQSWKPNASFQDSVLRYADSADWPGVKVDKKTEMPVRTIKAEREGVFRATGVLMGVRFVFGV